MIEDLGFDDKRLSTDLRLGFPLKGVLPPCVYNTVETLVADQAFVTETELLRMRPEMNRRVLAACMEVDFTEDVWLSTTDESTEGITSEPSPIFDEDLAKCTFTRRLPVREERSKGWRTRMVDHFTESQVNCATVLSDKTQQDSIDVQVVSVLRHVQLGHTPRPWKRDVTKNFRSTTIAQRRLQYSWEVFKWLRSLWKAQHEAQPFGSVSAAYAWHRIANFL